MKKKLVKILNKKFNRPITCLTAYSPAVAKLLDGNVDIVLIGDSLGSTLYGMQNARSVTLSMMKTHGLSVTNYIKKSITVIDMPYKTYTTKLQALKNASLLLKYTKAKILKLEINRRNLSIVEFLSNKSLNVIAHIGVTPQSYVNFKKIRAVGKSKIEGDKLLKLALDAERAGACAILLECVNQKIAKKITSLVSIPTIGIGSSKYCDGQILVFDDLINYSTEYHKPKFVKTYANFNQISKVAIKSFSKDVINRKFPSKKYSYQ